MARRLAKPCSTPGCKRVVRGRSRCKECAAKVEAERGSAHARGYDREWAKLRAAHLAAEPLCRSCKAEGQTVEAVEVDHILPRADGGADGPENLQSLCKACHSRKTAQANMVAVWVLEVEIVCGPPGAGREEHVLKHMQLGDLLLDNAEILAAISGLPKYQACDALLPLVEHARSALLELAKARAGQVRKVWAIAAGATARQRAAVLGRIEPTKVTTLDPGEKQCARRIKADEYRADQLDALLAEGTRWRLAHAREEVDHGS